MMKGYAIGKYGPPEDLVLQDLPKPEPKENEVLVQVKASAVNDYDWSLVRGKPRLYRLIFGLLKPRSPIPGMELSGIVEAVGFKVSKFKIGDDVFGDISDHGFGSFAEYISINEKALTIKPESMSFEDAAAMSHASMLAYQGLVELGEIKDGDKVLVNGAGGGVGTFGLQIAKMYNANVTGVDTGDKLETMKSIGYDRVIDYRKEEFTKNGEQYDLILDAKTNRNPFSYLKSLKPNCKYITVGGTPGRLIQMGLSKFWIRKFTGKSLDILMLKANKDLKYINQLFEEGKVKPVIDGPYPLNEFPKALRRFGEGKHAGKVIITFD